MKDGDLDRVIETILKKRNWPPQYDLPDLRGRQTHTDIHRLYYF